MVPHYSFAQYDTAFGKAVDLLVVADAGVLVGQSATTHHDTLPVVEQSHPEVQWVLGKRWVDSGQFISSAGITSGVDATLHTLV